jgi:hypothetical protein
MRKLALFLCTAFLAFGADDPWAKLKELKTGTELRVFKKGAAQPVLVKMDELTDDNLVVINKNEQTAIPRDQIDRVDYRPSGSRVTRQSTTKVTDGVGDPKSVIPGPNGAASGPSTSTSSGLSIGSKPDFETVYKRPPSAAPKKN